MTNISHNEDSCESQCKMIANHLALGNALTQMEALDRFRCFRLASRIHDLRKRGLDIERTMIIAPSGKRVAQYRLKQPKEDNQQ